MALMRELTFEEFCKVSMSSETKDVVQGNGVSPQEDAKNKCTLLHNAFKIAKKVKNGAKVCERTRTSIVESLVPLLQSSDPEGSATDDSLIFNIATMMDVVELPVGQTMFVLGMKLIDSADKALSSSCHRFVSEYLKEIGPRLPKPRLPIASTIRDAMVARIESAPTGAVDGLESLMTCVSAICAHVSGCVDEEFRDFKEGDELDTLKVLQSLIPHLLRMMDHTKWSDRIVLESIQAIGYLLEADSSHYLLLTPEYNALELIFGQIEASMTSKDETKISIQKKSIAILSALVVGDYGIISDLIILRNFDASIHYLLRTGSKSILIEAYDLLATIALSDRRKWLLFKNFIEPLCGRVHSNPSVEDEAEVIKIKLVCLRNLCTGLMEDDPDTFDHVLVSGALKTLNNYLTNQKGLLATVSVPDDDNLDEDITSILDR